MEYTTDQTAIEACSYCSATLKEEDVFCSECGYPSRGSQTEKDRFAIRTKLKKELLAESQKKVSNARIVLYVLAGANILIGGIMGIVQDDVALLISSIILGAVYIGLASWCQTQPFSAILTGFIIYITLIVIEAFVDPASIVSGIILKVIFISIFIKGLSSAKDAQEVLKELKKMPGK